jgi:hypothetical protein
MLLQKLLVLAAVALSYVQGIANEIFIRQYKKNVKKNVLLTGLSFFP